MTNWIADEHGNQIFTHEGWEVRICSPDVCRWNRIQITSPWSGVEVEVWRTGMWVKGWDEAATSAFAIPWEIIAAIGSARQIVPYE